MRDHNRPMRSLRVQLLIYMILLISIPLLFMTSFGNYFYAQAIDEQATSYTAQMLSQVQLNIDSNIHAVDQIIRYLSEDRDVQAFLRVSSFYSDRRVEIETEARKRMSLFVDANKELISGILIANRHDLYISNEMYRLARYSLAEDDWYQRAASTPDERLLISKPIGRNVRNIHNYSADDIVSVVSAVKDPGNGQVLGVICVDMQLRVIENHIRDLTLGKSGYVFVIDNLGQVVYAPVNPSVYRIQPEWVLNDVEPQRSLHTVQGTSYQLLSSHSSLTGWNTVGVFRSGEALEPVLALRQYTLWIALAAVLVATITALTFSSSFTGPISRLRLLMGQAEQGNLNVSFNEPNKGGEIAQLGHSFNSMMDKIRSLLHLVYVEQRNKREADIRTLQAQIKPHFLYNTLDTIRWMAEERGASEIVQMVSALTRVFRIGLSRGKEIISLSDELEHVKSYLYIQKVRYEEKLNYEIDAPEEVLNDQVNKLILQPLVENALYHGIKQKRGEGHIQISARERDGRLLIRVSDDGAGMTKERCDQLNQALRVQGNQEYAHGYGIFNVNDRIRLSYGDEYGLSYTLNEEGGVTVSIVHPIVKPGGQFPQRRDDYQTSDKEE